MHFGVVIIGLMLQPACSSVCQPEYGSHAISTTSRQLFSAKILGGLIDLLVRWGWRFSWSQHAASNCFKYHEYCDTETIFGTKELIAYHIGYQTNVMSNKDKRCLGNEIFVVFERFDTIVWNYIPIDARLVLSLYRKQILCHSLTKGNVVLWTSVLIYFLNGIAIYAMEWEIAILYGVFHCCHILYIPRWYDMCAYIKWWINQ